LNKNLLTLFFAMAILVLILSGCFLLPPVNPLQSPQLISPENGATEVLTNVKLSWNESGFVHGLKYRVMFGTSGMPLYLKTVQSTSATVVKLSYSSTYYWQIAALNSYGKTATSAIWHFTTESTPN